MRTLFLAILLLLSGWVEAQQLSVKSFRKLENDLSARGSEGRTDQNGDRCAIIKIVTTERNFVFEPDALGTMGTEQKTGEIWLYVPYGAKRLTIKHPVYGILRDYMYTEQIDKACVYELVLNTTRVLVAPETSRRWKEDDVDFSSLPQLNYNFQTSPFIVGDQAYVLFTLRKTSASYTKSIHAKDEEQSRFLGRTVRKYYHIKAHKETVSVAGFYKYDFLLKKWLDCTPPPYRTYTVEISENPSFSLGRSGSDFGLEAIGNFIFTLKRDYVYHPPFDKWLTVPTTFEQSYLVRDKIIKCSADENSMYLIHIYNPAENSLVLAEAIPQKKGFISKISVVADQVYFVISPENRKKIALTQVYLIDLDQEKVEEISEKNVSFFYKVLETSADGYKL